MSKNIAKCCIAFIVASSCFINIAIEQQSGTRIFVGANIFCFIFYCCIVFALFKTTQRLKEIVEEKYNVSIAFKYDFLIVFIPFLWLFKTAEICNELLPNIMFSFGNMRSGEITITILIAFVIVFRIMSVVFAIPVKKIKKFNS